MNNENGVFCNTEDRQSSPPSGFCSNVFILVSLVSLVSCLLSQPSKIRGNVAMFILGSTFCNLVNLSLWPMTIHWKQHGVMVGAKQLTISASFCYVSLITFSVYLTALCDCRRLVNSRLFLAMQLLFPVLPGVLKHHVGIHVDHLDPVKLTCFSFINDEVARVLLLVQTVVFLPLSLYFYADILHTIIQSATVMHRSQRVNVHLTKVFSFISFVTFTAHVPGAVFALMKHLSVCQEMVRDFLLDLPLLSSPIILLCMKKELRSQCLVLLQRNPTNRCTGKRSTSKTDEQHKNLTAGGTDLCHP
ncbi:hypothetical protein VZT92_023227 [Zoarces viviparus]|uniref:G-protein coupled receptors family 1 profile domain-containing protein n=1 Tax=Zoarces viviparus TaxID=48416 RepID=A0AAW1E7W4_ZOAVI